MWRLVLCFCWIFEPNNAGSMGSSMEFEPLMARMMIWCQCQFRIVILVTLARMLFSWMVFVWYLSMVLRARMVSYDSPKNGSHWCLRMNLWSLCWFGMFILVADRTTIFLDYVCMMFEHDPKAMDELCADGRVNWHCFMPLLKWCWILA